MGTLSWNNNDAANKTFTVQLCSDILTETTETAILTLSNPIGGVTIGLNNPATLNIFDVASQYCNADGVITIPAGAPTTTVGPATPYPSVINVAGSVGTISSMRVSLYNVTHTFGNDIDVLLVGPGGQKFILMSDVGDSAGFDLPATMTFSDTGVAIPLTGAIPTGTYLPTDITALDTFVAPAPVGPYVSPAPVGTGTLNGTFGGGSANGTWQLFVVDDVSGDVGTISGWCLEFTTLAPTPGTIQFSSTTYSGNEGTMATITATRTAGNSGVVSVDYATGGGTATPGTCGTDDYVAAMGTLMWPDMDSANKTFTVQLCSDAVVDVGETFNLTLSNVTGGATIGANNPAVLTIGDIPPPFSGAYTVGSGGNYPSLTNSGGIFEAINLAGASGPVTINIVSDMTGETGAVPLNPIAGNPAVLIKPSGAPRTISGIAPIAVIRINGADNIRIDGSTAAVRPSAPDVVGGTPALRELTVQNLSEGIDRAEPKHIEQFRRDPYRFSYGKLERQHNQKCQGGRGAGYGNPNQSDNAVRYYNWRCYAGFVGTVPQ
jgi:subtilisin-like proprotein convertase family protein